MKITNEKSERGFGIYIILQILVLVFAYGFKLELPWWVMWSPSLVIGIALAIFLCFMFFILIGYLVAWIINK